MLELIRLYSQLGVVANELNRTTGLTDLLPDVANPLVVAKLQFIDGLVRPAPTNGA